MIKIANLHCITTNYFETKAFHFIIDLKAEVNSTWKFSISNLINNSLNLFNYSSNCCRMMSEILVTKIINCLISIME